MTKRTENGELSVGITMLDRDHREMTEAIQELKESVWTGKNRSHTVSLLRRLAHFTLTHFALEEGIMAATNYPWMDLHRIEHQCFTGQLASLIAHCTQSGFMQNDPSLEFLSEAHINHIQKDDLRYGLWLNQHGVN